MGIPLTLGFDMNAALPLDSRYIFANTTARDALVSGVRFEGLVCYVVADQKAYILKGGIANGNWAEFGSGSSIVVTTDQFSGNGSTTAFTLTTVPGGTDNIFVYVNGVYQLKGTYSVAGTTLTFSVAPPTGTTNIEVKYGVPINAGTPADGSVTTIKIFDGSVTTPKIADGAVTHAKMAPRTGVQSSVAGLGEVLSTASSGAFSTSSTSDVNVTNLSGQITTEGRPVRLAIESYDLAGGSIRAAEITSGTAGASLKFFRGATQLNNMSIFGSVTASLSGYIIVGVPPSSFSHTDIGLAAGTYTYTVKVQASSGTSIAISNCKLVAYEI